MQNSTQNITKLFSDITIRFEYYHRSPFASICGCLLTTFIAVIAILGNSAVVLASFWDETLRRQTGNILIVHLAFTDIFTAFLVQLPSAISIAADYWPFGTVFCRMNTGFNYMLACSSSMTISLIGIDRAFAMLYPLRYKTLITVKVMIAFCSGNLVLATMAHLFSSIPNFSHYDYLEATCALDYLNNLEVFYLYTTGFSVCYVLPALVVAFCHYVILKAAKKSGSRPPQPLFVKRHFQKVPVVMQSSSTNKTLKSMIVVVCTYYVCFTPYSIAKQVKVVTGIDMPPWFNYLTTILIYISSAVNPFIYGILRKDFRNAFKKLPRMLKEKLFNF